MDSELPDAADSASYHEETDTYRATFDNADITPSIAVVEVMATVLERDATEMPSLAEVIDPEALDQFLMTRSKEPHGSERTVEFTFVGHEVTILSCGLIKVQPIATEE